MVHRDLVHRLWLPNIQWALRRRGSENRSQPHRGYRSPGSRAATLPPQGWGRRSPKDERNTNQHTHGIREEKKSYASASHGRQTLRWHPIAFTGNPRLILHLSQRGWQAPGWQREFQKAGTKGKLQASTSVTSVTLGWESGQMSFRGSALGDRRAFSRFAQSVYFWEASSSDYESKLST